MGPIREERLLTTHITVSLLKAWKVTIRLDSAICQLEGEIFPYCPLIIARAYSDAEVI